MNYPSGVSGSDINREFAGFDGPYEVCVKGKWFWEVIGEYDSYDEAEKVAEHKALTNREVCIGNYHENTFVTDWESE